MASAFSNDRGTGSEGEPKVRGILKKSSSIDKDGMRCGQSNSSGGGKEMKWDEMNILQTYHPADKDYGHQKITDPPTPYSHMIESDKSGDEDETLDPQCLADCLKKKSTAKVLTVGSSVDDDDDDDDNEEQLSEEAKAKKRAFRNKRKMHYNEFYAAKMRQQMLDDEDEEDENGDANDVKSSTQGDVSETTDSTQTSHCSSSAADCV